MEAIRVADEPELLDPAADAGHVPVVHQRHRAEHDGVHRRHLARAGAVPRRSATRPRSRSNRRAAARTPSTSRSTSTTASSDHVTYMQHGIPAVMFITWPDMWYHSSEDTPDKQDPTQYKRAAAVGAGLAGGADAPAPTRWRRASRRTTWAAASRAWASRTPRDSATWPMRPTPRRSRRRTRKRRTPSPHQAAIEKAVVRSASVLWTNVADGREEDCGVRAADRPARGGAAERSEGGVSAAGRRSAALPQRNPLRRRRNAKRRRSWWNPSPVDGAVVAAVVVEAVVVDAAAPADRRFQRNSTRNSARCSPKRMTALQIRDFLSGEFTPLPLADVMAVLRARAAAGQVTLVKK